ncbi:Hypothetical predicted protein [Prunus dulcis]|uniref:Uncharacterized protein n=1 Tax=Prunus dulcis TaxID=3755 RepID=A0A5E4G519_PRUDU|nr:Hypothetical predicted protein [Prunus dulcis]
MRVPKVKGLLKAQSCMSQGDVAGHEGAEGIRIECRKGDGPRHEGEHSDTKLACLQGDVLNHGGAKGKEDAEGDGPRHEGAHDDTKLACLQGNVLRHGVRKAKRMPKARRCRRRHKVCMLQGNVLGHEECRRQMAKGVPKALDKMPKGTGAEGSKLAWRKAVCLDMRLSKAQSLHVKKISDGHETWQGAEGKKCKCASPSSWQARSWVNTWKLW